MTKRIRLIKLTPDSAELSMEIKDKRAGCVQWTKNIRTVFIVVSLIAEILWKEILMELRFPIVKYFKKTVSSMIDSIPIFLRE